MKGLKLTNGGVTFVSDEDYDYLSQFRWHKSQHNQKIYIKGLINNSYVFIHRIIAKRIGLNLSQSIDHVDRNPLNNQRENLRSATQSQNTVNSEIRKNNTSGYKGVSWCKRDKRWYAYITIGQKKIHLGCFETVKQAAQMYDRVALKVFGEFAYTNFPKEGYS